MSGTTLVGLDVGSTSIRAVEATAAKDRPVVSNFGQSFLPAGAVVAGVVKDDKAVTGALRQLWTAHDFSSRKIVLGVTHQQMVVREIDVTNLPARELKQALPFLVRDVLPLPVEQALLDFYPLEDPGKADSVHGLLIAAPKDAVIDMVRAVEAANLHVVHVDLACFAALRASAHVNSDTEAVLDIGANATTIVIHTDGVPKIVRTIPRGGAEVTKMLASRLGISTEEAEVLKCRVGLDAAESSEAADVAAEALRPLVTEIRNSLNYFGTAHPDDRVTRLALVGGASMLAGLPGALTRQIGVPAYLSDPLQRVSDPRRGGKHDILGRFRSSAAVSIGLTLGAA
ncbi:MAG: type IV pilus assembly protein PilM [Jatrophihabitans sp.]|uniref:type IV pilus assembly protein PilM n=1 Tax=Jatrophihabitans sp. TaxID=1932789 RepID=UPI003F7D5BD5